MSSPCATIVKASRLLTLNLKNSFFFYDYYFKRTFRSLPVQKGSSQTLWTWKLNDWCPVKVFVKAGSVFLPLANAWKVTNRISRKESERKRRFVWHFFFIAPSRSRSDRCPFKVHDRSGRHGVIMFANSRDHGCVKREEQLVFPELCIRLMWEAKRMSTLPSIFHALGPLIGRCVITLYMLLRRMGLEREWTPDALFFRADSSHETL